MYNGDEKLINNGVYLPFTMLNFWQWSMSNIRFGMTRGTFADFIVKCALDSGGIPTRTEIGTGIEEYDLEGPVIPSLGRASRIEVKSSAYLNSESGNYSERCVFSISPAKVLIDNDYKRDAPRQRNNDIYVFTLYTAPDNHKNILDLAWWEFFVLPTYRIEDDKNLSKQKTISLKRVKEYCPTLSFDMVCDAIIDACNSIPAKSLTENTPPRTAVRQFGGGWLISSRFPVSGMAAFLCTKQAAFGNEAALLTKVQIQKYPGRFLSGVLMPSFGKKNYMALHLDDIMGLLANIILPLGISKFNLIFFSPSNSCASQVSI